jgi:hypothetical protein
MRTLRVRRANLRAAIDTEPGAVAGTRTAPGDSMSTDKTLLELALEHAAAHPDRTFLTQPLGGGPVAAYTWGQVADQSRRMGISGVPFFVFNQKLAASGAQPPEALLGVMRQAAGSGAT